MRIVITDDHPLFREAVELLLQRLHPGAEVDCVETFGELQQLLRKVDTPDLLLLDLDLPDTAGLASLAHLGARYPDIQTAIISGDGRNSSIRQAQALGAIGYIPKSMSPREMLGALEILLQGEHWFPETRSEAPTSAIAEDERLAQCIAQLTQQQLRVLRAIADGKLNKQIAIDFNITEGTVKGHVTAILRIMNLRRRTQLALAAQRVLLGNRIKRAATLTEISAAAA